eukprot:gb/GECG01002264.1/.p1 GENE.gb/GECG01002264.1/~~gb/GECG01002264.1/.p1  ORF type:complete len:391 (+),score=38.72 gb/GECG01002264.1/:1-1173(+)
MSLPTDDVHMGEESSFRSRTAQEEARSTHEERTESDITRLRLVVIADDCGYDAVRDTGILECFEESGVISGGSLLVNGSSAAQFVEKAVGLKRAPAEQDSGEVYQKANPETDTKFVPQVERECNDSAFSLGLHLNLTEGVPCSSSCFCEENGLTVPEKQTDGSFIQCFRGKYGFRRALQAGSVSDDSMICEMCAQIDRFVYLRGGPPSHLDGHQHIHVIPEVASCIIRALSRYSWANGLWIRVPHMMPEELDHCSKTQPCHVSDFLHNVSYNASVTKAMFAEVKLRTSDYFMGCGVMGKCMSTDTVLNLLKCAINRATRSRKNVLEFMCHPGNASSGEGGCGVGPDEFSMAADREHETRVLKELGRKLHHLKRNMRKDNVHLEVAYFPDP